MRLLLILIEFLLVLSVAYGIVGLTLYFMQSSFLYKPLREVCYTPEELGLDFEKVTFQTADGLHLRGWYVPAQSAGRTVLFCHGNGGNMMHCLDSVNIFYNLGMNCFIFDYRGYGESDGQKPTEAGTYLDAEAAYRWLTENRGVPADSIIIFGRSLGGSVAAQLASSVKACSLVLESTFTSYADIGSQFYPYMPVRWFAAFKYDTVGFLEHVRCPIMIIHSPNDEIIPYELGRKLYEVAGEPKKFVEISGNHNDGFLTSGEVYKNAWINWIRFLKNYRDENGLQDVAF